MDKLFKDLYKLENDGTYFLRVTPSEVSREFLNKLRFITQHLRVNRGIEICILEGDKGMFEFMPQPKRKD